MEILIGLAIAAAVVYGWARGFVLVAIFLTLGVMFPLLLLGFTVSGNPTPLFIGLAALAIIWAPIALRSRQPPSNVTPR